MVDLIQRMFARLFKRPQPPVRPPWYTGPPTFPDAPRVFQPPPPPVRTAAREPVSIYNDPLNNTRPIQRVEETRPTIPAAPAIDSTPMTDITKRYDHLFPPPQPGDEDYLEFDHDDTTLPPPMQAGTQSPVAQDSADEIDTEPLEGPPPAPPGDLPA